MKNKKINNEEMQNASNKKSHKIIQQSLKHPHVQLQFNVILLQFADIKGSIEARKEDNTAVRNRCGYATKCTFSTGNISYSSLVHRC